MAGGLTAVTALLGALVIGLAIAVDSLPDSADGLMIAIFPPGVTAAAAFDSVVEAGGRPLRPLALGNSWIVAGDHPGYAGRLRELGALLVLDNELTFGTVLGGCAGTLPIVPRDRSV